jgi:hypothetical protein
MNRMRNYKTGSELIAIEQEISGTVVVRSYVNGCSRDNKRPATGEERAALRAVTLGALNQLNFNRVINRDVEQAVIDTAEWILTALLAPCDKIIGPYDEHVNTYDTIYLPLQRVIAAWDAEPETEADA